MHPDLAAIFRTSVLGFVSSDSTRIAACVAAPYTEIAERLSTLSRPLLVEILFESWNSPVALTSAFGDLLPNLPDSIIRRIALAMLIRNQHYHRENIRDFFSPAYALMLFGDKKKPAAGA